MGQSNAAVKQWMSKQERFADLFNGIIFQGKQVVLPEELESVDSEVTICGKLSNGFTEGFRHVKI